MAAWRRRPIRLLRNGARYAANASALGQLGVIAEELQAPGVVGGGELSRNSRRNSRESTRDRKEEAGPAGDPALPSGEMPPPGTMMWTCGWWVSAEPQVCSTAVRPIRAPRCLGSAAMVMQRLGRGLEQEVVDDGLVLVGDVADRRRQREDDVVVGHRQQLGLALGQPFLAAAPWHFGQCRLRQEL